jgi:hypothetical protein
MNASKFCFISAFIVSLILDVVLFYTNFQTLKKLEDFMKHQEAVNSNSLETNKNQDKEIRIIKQDNDIFWNLVLYKDFVKEND